MHSRTSAVAIFGSLAISGALLLAGCGGSSTATAPSAAASTEPSAGASAEGDATTTEIAPEGSASGAFAPVADGAVSYQAWNDMFGKGDIELYITNTGAEPVLMDSFNLLQSQGSTSDGSSFQVNASSCGMMESIPAGAYTTCFLSGFESGPHTFTDLNLTSVAGDGSIITVPVSAGELERPVWK
jgi:hypothetical protein